MIVVDASVAVKWYVTEPFSDLATQFYAENRDNLVAPDIFIVEVVATLVRRANIEKSFRPDVERSIANLLELVDADLIVAHRTAAAQMAAAANLALDLGHPLKDCIYLALAMEMECELVTCDARFAAKARGVWDRVRVLGV